MPTVDRYSFTACSASSDAETRSSAFASALRAIFHDLPSRRRVLTSSRSASCSTLGKNNIRGFVTPRRLCSARPNAGISSAGVDLGLPVRRRGRRAARAGAAEPKGSHMDLVEAYKVAAAQSGELIAKTRADQLETSTPCRTWTARELINHIVAGQYMFAGAAAGKPLPDMSGGTPDFAAGDAAAAQRDACAALSAVFADPAMAERMAELPFGTLPAAMVPGLACFEQVVHGWDLATATGQVQAVPDEVVEVLFPFAEQVLANAPRDGVAFDVVVDPPAGASALDRLVALSGRRP